MDMKRMDINLLNSLLDHYRRDQGKRFRDNKGPPLSSKDSEILEAIKNLLGIIQQGFILRVEVSDSGMYTGQVRRIKLQGNRLYFELMNSLPAKIAEEFRKGVDLKRVAQINILQNGDLVIQKNQRGEKNEERE